VNSVWRRRPSANAAGELAFAFRAGLSRLALSLQRRRKVVAYLVPCALSALAVQTWFQAGTAIASGDIPPPIAPEVDYTSHWSHVTSGEGGPGYHIVASPYAAWLDLWEWLGGSAELGQRVWLSVLFTASAAAVVFLVFGFTSSAVAAGTAGLLASFNPYRLIVGPDTVPMTAMLVAALLAGFLARAALRPEQKGSVLGFAIASVGLGYVMANPPQVAVVLLWLAACFVVSLAARPSAVKRLSAFLVRAVPLALVLNAWWIVPAWLTIAGPGFEDRFAAAGVDEWTWTHARATLTNALTLNTTWAWSYREYFPYADRLDDAPFGDLKACLPVLAVVGVLLARRRDRRLALGLAVTALVAVWLATGLNGPVPAINRWFYDHVPGFWLFREPSKFLLLVLLAFAVLGGFAVSRLVAIGRSRRAALPLAVGLVAGAVFYSHPLFTGEVIADERPLLPSAHVALPEGWRDAAEELNSQPDIGKVLVLPRSDFYQVPTTWGYYGTSFTRWLIERPVIESHSSGYLRADPGAVAFEESIERDLVDGRPVDVRKKLAALGVRYVLLRRDVDPDFPNRRIVRPRVLAQNLARVPEIRRLRSFGLLDLYRVDGTGGNEIFPTTPTFYAGSRDALIPAVSVIRALPGVVSGTADRASLIAAGVGPQRVFRFEAERVRRLAARRRGRMLHVRLTDPIRFGGRTLPPARTESVAMPLPAETPLVITVGENVIPLRGARDGWWNLGLVGRREGESVGVWGLVGARGVDVRSGGPVGDCHAADARTPKQVGLRAGVVESAGAPTLRLSARAHAACVALPLVPDVGSEIYTVRFRYRTVAGAPARACLWLRGANRCAAAPELRPGRQWQTFEASLRPDRGTTAITVFLYAEGRGGVPATVTEYQRIRLERYERLRDVLPAPQRLQPLAQSPFFERRLALARASVSSPLDIAAAGPVGDCNRYDARTPAQVGLGARVTDHSGSPVIQLRARDHSACVSFPISSFVQGVHSYRIRLQYRSVRGVGPRVCLWQDGPNRCAPLSALPTDREWRVFDEEIRLDPDARALRLYLYADGGGDGPTVNEYRDIDVGPLGSVAIIGEPPRRSLPVVLAQRETPWKLRVKIRNAREPFLLVTSEAYDPGWEAESDRGRDSALRHIRVNGFANGWLVPWHGSYELTLEYEPEQYARGARWLSLFAPVLALGWIGRRRIRFAATKYRWRR
jgi:arabinofuranan 3-O-arabinosyltransferase